MDIFAVISAVRDAAERARNGEGATLIEAVTYRFRPHSLSDDASKYRSKEEEGQWSEKDPIARLAKYLEKKGLWTEEDTLRVKDEAKATVNEQIKKLNKPKNDNTFT